MTTILVSGAIANKPFNGGAAWTRLNYVLGLRSLGFDVYFVEQINTAACIDTAGSPASFESSANRSYFRRISEEFGLTARMGLICTESGCVEGVSYTDVLDAAESAALLVNISGHLTDKDILRRVRRKAYIDLDPGFTQFWHNAGSDASRLAGHDYYFTIGENIGS